MIFILIMFLVFIIILLLNVPIAFTLGIAGSIPILMMGTSMEVLSMKIFYGLDAYTLLCIPFFILSGEFMTNGKITDALLEFAVALIGFVRGGLALANVIASMLFGGMTGTAIGDVTALGSVEISMMVKNGYDKEFSAAITSASALIGPIIPPSNPAVLYCIATGTSIGGLFLAGVVPGLLLGFGLMATIYYISLKRKYPKSEKMSIKKILISFKNTIPALFMPIIILGGILGGIFTPTEASAVAAAYAFVLSVFFLRTIKISDVPKMLLKSAITTSVVMIIVATSNLFSWVLAINKVGVIFGRLFSFCTPLTFIILVNILILILGTFIDTPPLILIFAPILAPLSVRFGLHPIHFGVIFILGATLGLLTPPVGQVLFIASSIAKVQIVSLSKEILLFLLIEIGILFLISFTPFLTLWLPNLFGFL